MNPSFDSCGRNTSETSSHIWIVPRRSLRGHDDRSKYIGIYSAE